MKEQCILEDCKSASCWSYFFFDSGLLREVERSGEIQQGAKDDRPLNYDIDAAFPAVNNCIKGQRYTDNTTHPAMNDSISDLNSATRRNAYERNAAELSIRIKTRWDESEHTRAPNKTISDGISKRRIDLFSMIVS